VNNKKRVINHTNHISKLIVTINTVDSLCVLHIHEKSISDSLVFIHSSPVDNLYENY
jgi:hypothetical protein